MEQCTIMKADGNRLKAVYAVPQGDFKQMVVICHGFSGAKENSGYLFSFAEKLTANGFAVLAFDFLGSGESDGKFADVTLSGQMDDLKAVIDYIEQKFGVPVILLGRSFGGSTVIGLGSDPRVVGCVLWSAAVYLEDVFKKGFGENYDLMEKGETIHAKIIQSDIEMKPSFVQDLKKHDMEAYLRGMAEKPVFALQGLNDWLVAAKNAELVKELCPKADVHFIEKADHRFADQKDFRDDMTIEWLHKHF